MTKNQVMCLEVSFVFLYIYIYGFILFSFIYIYRDIYNYIWYMCIFLQLQHSSNGKIGALDPGGLGFESGCPLSKNFFIRGSQESQPPTQTTKLSISWTTRKAKVMPCILHTLSLIIMEVENYPKWKETNIGSPFSTEPWLWEEGCPLAKLFTRHWGVLPLEDRCSRVGTALALDAKRDGHGEGKTPDGYVG